MSFPVSAGMLPFFSSPISFYDFQYSQRLDKLMFLLFVFFLLVACSVICIDRAFFISVHVFLFWTAARGISDKLLCCFITISRSGIYLDPFQMATLLCSKK